ncbi:MAG: helix-hairpin-helix domain-containing protein [Nanoarchaeota archaeon]
MKFWIFALAIFLINFVSAECNSTQIDINTASLEELMGIKWLGGTGSTAQKVIDARPFISLDDLKKVNGLGGTGAKVEDIKSQGLACVENENMEEENQTQTNNNNNNEAEESNNNENETAKKIVATANAVSELENPEDIVEEIENEPIILSPQDIKSEKSFWSSGNSLPLISLGVFSVVIGILVFFKFKTKKNELV